MDADEVDLDGKRTQHVVSRLSRAFWRLSWRENVGTWTRLIYFALVTLNQH